MYNKLLEILLAVGLICGAWFYAGHRAVESYKQEQLIEQAFATQAQQARYDELAGKYETLRDKRATDAKTIIREVEKVVDRPIYRNDCFDERGLQLANQALSGKTVSVPTDRVPAAE